MKYPSSKTRPSSFKAIAVSLIFLLLLGTQVSSAPSTHSLDNSRHDVQQQRQQPQQRHDQYNDFTKRQDSDDSPSPSPTTNIITPISPSSFPSPYSPPASLPSPSAAQPQQPPGILLPQNQPNVSQRIFPFTPATGTNNSLSITPNVTLRTDLVEIKIGVLLPYSLPNNLTQELTFSGTSAIRLAVSEINANQLIPGAYVTLVLKDSFNGLDAENSGAAQAIFSTVSLLQTNGGVSGVIGDVSSALSVQSALLTSRLSIPQCSYSAGSTQLSNKDDYSYFFRTIPTELMFGQVMVDFVASRGWKSIAVFYTGDSLGSQMMDNIALRASERNIKVGFRRTFWETGGSTDVGPALEALKDSGHRIVLIAAVGLPQIRMMIDAVNKGLVNKDYVWLTINQITQPLLDSNSTLKPQDLNGLFMFDNLLKLQGYPPYEKFLDKWAALNPTQYPYAGQRDISSNEAQAYSCMMVMANGFANAVRGNGTALRLLAAGRLGNKLKPLNMNTNYTGPGGPMVFDDNGDVAYGNFILYNFQNNKIVPIGTSYSGAFNLTSPPMYFDGTYNTPADSAPLEVLNPKFGSTIGMVIISVAGLSVLFSLLAMLIVVVYRDAQVIKASSPLFCCLELLGFILLYISVVMGLDIPTDTICMIRPFTLNVGFVLVVSNIVAKNFRVYRIFHNIYVTKRVIRDSHLLKIVGTLLTFNLIVMAVWFIKTPPMLQQIIMPNFTSYWTCDNQNGPSTPFFVVMFAYNAVLLLVATFLAYKNRNVAANYNECRQIAFVVYNILLAGCLAMPTIFLPPDEFLTKFFLSTVVILFGTTFSLMFLFLPKLWELFTQIERSQQRAASVTDLNLGPHMGGGGGGGFDNDGNEISGDGSLDGFLYNNAAAAWMNSAGNLAVLGPGVTSAPLPGGSSTNASSVQLPMTVSGVSIGRKGSVVTLEESKGESTLKESHVGYMGVKYQSRYFSFLSSWCMKRVMLYPAGRYFTCFDVGKPDTGRTFTYISVFIHSREEGAYILKVVGCCRYDFLLQVRDEERLLYWFNLFENGRQQVHRNLYTNSSISSLGVGSVLPMENTSAVSTYNAPPTLQISVGDRDEEVEREAPPGDLRSESDRTLFVNMDHPSQTSLPQRHLGQGQNSDQIDPNLLSPMQFYNWNQQQQQRQQQGEQQWPQDPSTSIQPVHSQRGVGCIDNIEMAERGRADIQQPWDIDNPLDSMELSLPPSRNPSMSTNPFVRRQQQQQQQQQQHQQILQQ